MLDSIYIGMTGLLGFSQGLKTIANNTANMNTPGFKSSTLQFGDLIYTDGQSEPGANGGVQGHGFGLNTYGTTLNFNAGELRQTNNDLDVGVDGIGMFMVRTPDGSVRYTRAGQFEFNDAGLLVTRTGGMPVFGMDANGNVGIVSLDGYRTSPAVATKTVKLTGNLSSTATDQTVNNINVYDAAGVQHTLSLKLNNGSATTPGSWKVSVLDGTTSIGTGSLLFKDGKPDPSTSTVQFTYSPPGQTPMDVTLDFSKDVTSFASGNLSTIAASGQDGFAAGSLTKETFDKDGFLVLSYSNGETRKGDQLLLATFDSADAVESAGGNLFKSTNDALWHIGVANSRAFGSIKANSVEISNVNLSGEFSDLVIMQRGYQASSQVITTANDMIEQLFSMKSGK